MNTTTAPITVQIPFHTHDATSSMLRFLSAQKSDNIPQTCITKSTTVPTTIVIISLTNVHAVEAASLMASLFSSHHSTTFPNTVITISRTSSDRKSTRLNSSHV